MKYRFIPACVMLTAGLVCCIMSIVQRWDVTYSLIALLHYLRCFPVLPSLFLLLPQQVLLPYEAALPLPLPLLHDRQSLFRSPVQRSDREYKTTKIMKQKHCDGVSLSE